MCKNIFFYVIVGLFCSVNLNTLSAAADQPAVIEQQDLPETKQGSCSGTPPSNCPNGKGMCCRNGQWTCKCLPEWEKDQNLQPSEELTGKVNDAGVSSEKMEKIEKKFLRIKA